MSDSISGYAADSVGSAAQHVAGALHTGIGCASDAARQAKDGVSEIRSVIRAQPITAALVVFTLGYLFGRVGSLIPSRAAMKDRG